MVDSKAAKELAIKLKFIDMSYQLEKDITADDISFLLEVLENKS